MAGRSSAQMQRQMARTQATAAQNDLTQWLSQGAVSIELNRMKRSLDTITSKLGAKVDELAHEFNSTIAAMQAATNEQESRGLRSSSQALFFQIDSVNNELLKYDLLRHQAVELTLTLEQDLRALNVRALNFTP